MEDPGDLLAKDLSTKPPSSEMSSFQEASKGKTKISYDFLKMLYFEVNFSNFVSL